VISGSLAQVKAMSVPYTNQVIIGGYFFEELIMGNITLNCNTSNNVYIGYLKDDTWLDSNILAEGKKCNIYPNPFLKHGEIITDEHILNVKVFNASAILIEEYNEDRSPITLGENWPKGLYFVHVLYKNGQSTMIKAVKI